MCELLAQGCYLIVERPRIELMSPTSKPLHHQAARIGDLKRKASPSPILDCRAWVPELIPVFGSQPAGDVSHKPGDRLPLLSARPAVTLATLERAATSFAAW